MYFKRGRSGYPPYHSISPSISVSFSYLLFYTLPHVRPLHVYIFSVSTSSISALLRPRGYRQYLRTIPANPIEGSRCRVNKLVFFFAFLTPCAPETQ